MKISTMLATALLLLSSGSFANGIITTVAGGGPNNVQALSAAIGDIQGTAVDGVGNTYLVAHNRVFKISQAGLLTVVAGNGIYGFSGDGGSATTASLWQPNSVSIDSSGNLYIVEEGRIRKVDAQTGLISTVAGNGSRGFSGDGGLATSAQLYEHKDVTVDNDGNLYIADYNNHRIRKVDALTGIISTVAGTGSYAYSGDGGVATAASLYRPSGVDVDSNGNLYIADTYNHRIRKVDALTGIISTVAGHGSAGYSGDGGNATSAGLSGPLKVSLDNSDNLYIADTGNSRIRKVDSLTGVISTVAGNGSVGFSGDGGPATSASLYNIFDVSVDSDKNLYIADARNNRIRKVDALTGVISTLAGNGNATFSGDGGPATAARINPYDISIDSSDNIYIADINNNRIRKVDTVTGIISTIAGDGSYGGATGLMGPYDISNDSSGNLYLLESNNRHQVRKVDAATGVISVVAGNGIDDDDYGTYSGDGGAATDAGLDNPQGISVDNSGNLYIADTGNSRIRKVDAVTGIISTVAGNGSGIFSGDNGPATDAGLSYPLNISLDSSGNIYIVGSRRIRKVDIDGIISTVAGTSSAGYNGDGIPATSASFSNADGISFDDNGNLYIADKGNNRIRKVDVQTGFISTVAGNGDFGFSGDGGDATGISLAIPNAVSVDSSGNLYISERGNGRIRKVTFASDIDGDGLGDLDDPCPDDATNLCDPGKSGGELISASSGGEVVTPDGSITMDIPSGALSADTPITITETTAATGSSGLFQLTTDLGGGVGVYGVEINPEGTIFNSPITLVFTWDDADNDGQVDGSTIYEQNLQIIKDGVAITGKCQDEPVGGALPDCDMNANSMTFQVSSLSVFVLALIDNQAPDVLDLILTPNPAPINTSLALSAIVSDLDLGDSIIDSAQYQLDDQPYAMMDASDGNFDQVEEAVNVDLAAFSEAGVHSLCIRGQDIYGVGFDGATGNGFSEPQCTLLAVYDPSAGFVTGGGWFESPAGAYTAEPELTGKAQFAFVSKYKKGKSVPDGNTQFQFKAGGLNFHSTAYDWLVIAGAKALFKGVGQVNGADGYGFILSAKDGDLNGDGGDTFRIKVWLLDNEEIIYDNQLGDDDDSEATTPLGGGSIVVHSVKKK